MKRESKKRKSKSSRLESSKFENWEGKKSEEEIGEKEGEEQKPESESFGQFIIRMRELNGWKQRDLLQQLYKIEHECLSKSRLSGIEKSKPVRDGKIVLPKEETVRLLARALQIPMAVMEAKLNGTLIPWEEVLLQYYGEQRLMQAREIINDALFVLEKTKTPEKEKKAKKTKKSKKEGEK